MNETSRTIEPTWSSRLRPARGTVAWSLLVLVVAGVAVRAHWRERRAQGELRQRAKEMAWLDVARGRNELSDQGQDLALAHFARALRSDPHSSLPAELAVNRIASRKQYPQVVIRGASNGFDRVHVSPDGRRLVTESSGSRSVQVWEWHTGRLLLTLPHPTNTVDARFTADGQRLVTRAADQVVRVWDASDGRLVRSLAWSNAMGKVQVSPDARRLLVGTGETTAEVRDTETGKWLWTLEQPDRLEVLRFSPDGRRVAVRGGNEVTTIWDAETGRRLQAMTHPHDLKSLPLSPDGRRLVSVSSNQVHVWDTDTGQRLRTLTLPKADNTNHWYDSDGKIVEDFPYQDCVIAAEFSPDGTRLVTTDRRSSEVRGIVWDVATGREVGKLYARGLLIGHYEYGEPYFKVSLCFSKDGRRLVEAWSEGSCASVYDTDFWTWTNSPRDSVEGAEATPDGRAGGAMLPARRHLWWHLAGFRSVQFSPDGRSLISLSTDGFVQVYKTEEAVQDEPGTMERQPCCGGDGFYQAVISSDGRHVLKIEDEASEVGVWDARTGRKTRVLGGHDGVVEHAWSSPDGRHIATVSKLGTVSVWAAEGGPRRHVFKGLHDACFSPDSQRLTLAGRDGVVEVRELSTGQRLSQKQVFAASVQQAWFSPDGARLVVMTSNGVVRVLAADTGRVLFALPGDGAIGHGLHFSSDGRRLVVVTSNGVVRVLGGDTGRVLREWSVHAPVMDRVEVSPDGRRLVTVTRATEWAEEATVQLWDTDSGQVVGELPWEKLSFQADEDSPEFGYQLDTLEFSPDSRRLLTVTVGISQATRHDGYSRGSLQMWDGETGLFLGTLETDVHKLDAGFCCEGKRVICFAGDGAVRTFRMFPVAAGPAPEWFADLLHYVAGSRLDAHGDLVVLPLGEWLDLRERLYAVRRVSAGQDGPYLEILREWVEE